MHDKINMEYSKLLRKDLKSLFHIQIMQKVKKNLLHVIKGRPITQENFVILTDSKQNSNFAFQ
jgi:hypothetical protein